jgi:hypothetical protein
VNSLSLSAYNRPEYLHRVVQAINACDSSGFDCVFVVIDKGNKEAEILFEIERLALPQTILLQTEHVNISKNILTALRLAFSQSDFNVHIEDDIVIAPDALRFALWVKEQKADFCEFFSRNQDQSAEIGAASYHPHFNPWGWACTKTIFTRYMEPDWNSRLCPSNRNLWDLAMHAVMEKHQLTALRPHLSRSLNIGRISTNETVDYFDQHLSGFNFSTQPYTGSYYIT